MQSVQDQQPQGYQVPPGTAMLTGAYRAPAPSPAVYYQPGNNYQSPPGSAPLTGVYTVPAPAPPAGAYIVPGPVPAIHNQQPLGYQVPAGAPMATGGYMAPNPAPAVHHQQVSGYQAPSGPVAPPREQTAPNTAPTVQGDKFSHLRHAPMFRLSAASDTPFHTHIVTETSYQITKRMRIYTSIITRWAAAGGGANGVVVDIYQIRNPFSMGASPFMVHTNRDVQIRLGGRFDVSARRGKVWSKHWTTQLVDDVMAIVDGAAIPLEKVERVEERVAPEEGEEVKSRFRRWSVPA